MSRRFVSSQYCFRLRQCTSHRNQASLSTSCACHAKIPPESPRFIQVPRLVQPKQPFPIQIKGRLPAPQKVFPRKIKGAKRQTSPEYLAAVAPEPVVDKTTRTDDEFLSWKARQSELRRRNLREGLMELGERKQKTDRRNAIIRAQNMRIRNKLLYARERNDVYLTSPSVLSSQQPIRHRGLPDPTRSTRLATSKQNVADMAAMREEVRRNALHNLYVNAGDFIMTDKQLDGVIEKAFDDNSQFRSDSSEGVNIWNLGYPETVQELLQKASKSGEKLTALDSAEGNEIITRERMRRIGEELTGGKMLEG